jgi:AraC-like DNA-binding protein
MSWNLRTVLLLLAFVQGAVAAVLLGARFVRRRRWSDCFLALLLLVLCGNLLPHLVGWAGAYDRWPGLSFFPFATSFATGPLIWFTVRALTEPDFRPSARQLPHAAPFLIEKAYYLWAWTQPLAWKNEFVPRWQDPVIAPIETVLSGISVALYFYAAWAAYRRYRAWVDDSQSDAAYQLEWLRNFLLVAGIAAATSLAFDLTSLVRPLGYPVFFFRALMFALLTYWLAGSALILDPRPAPSTNGSRLSTTHNRSTTIDSRSTTDPRPPIDQVFLARLESHMATTRPWLDSTLTLGELAGQLGVSTHTLSATINQGSGRNFNDFVNGYRVRAVQQALQSGAAAQKSLLAIAFDHGFNAKSTFNRAFRKETGLPPSHFLRP